MQIEWFRDWHIKLCHHIDARREDFDDDFIDEEWQFVEDDDDDYSDDDDDDSEVQHPQVDWYIDDDEDDPDDYSDDDLEWVDGDDEDDEEKLVHVGIWPHTAADDWCGEWQHA